MVEVIRKTFISDLELNKYCNPLVAKKSINQIVNKIHEDMSDWIKAGAMFDNMELDGELIGFVCYTDDVLVSFGVRKEFRNKDVLVRFFDLIKSLFENHFVCYMWERNTRGVNWLLKCGMELDDGYKSKDVVKLKY